MNIGAFLTAGAKIGRAGAGVADIEIGGAHVLEAGHTAPIGGLALVVVEVGVALRALGREVAVIAGLHTLAGLEASDRVTDDAEGDLEVIASFTRGTGRASGRLQLE